MREVIGEIEMKTLLESREHLNQRSFASDNNSGTIPEALEAIELASRNHVPAYGNDPVTAEARRLFKQHLGESAQAFFTFNGTAANLLCLRAMLKSYEAVICADSSHLNNDEGGAPEWVLGAKLLTVPTADGKLTSEGILSHLVRKGDPHHVQAKVVSITQPTEVGTLYTLKEMKELAQTCKDNDLLLHIDGSRLAIAAAALGCTFKEMTSDIGCDALSFGGTKNGLMLAEASVFFNKALTESVPFYQKQLLQLPGKSRYIAAQFVAFLRNETWKKYAQQSLEMATYLEGLLKDIPDISFTQKREANSLFARVPKKSLKAMREKFFFYVWDERTTEVRWMTTFDTTKDDVEEFVEEIRKALKATA